MQKQHSGTHHVPQVLLLKVQYGCSVFMIPVMQQLIAFIQYILISKGQNLLKLVKEAVLISAPQLDGLEVERQTVLRSNEQQPTNLNKDNTRMNSNTVLEQSVTL